MARLEGEGQAGTRGSTRRTVWLLFGCQAVSAALSLVQTAAGPLVGYSLAPTKALATLPQALLMLAAMGSGALAAAVFERFGRRIGFLLGSAGAGAGCLLYAAGLWEGSFALFCLGALPSGLGVGLTQHLRFAAAENAPARGGARAVALVMGGGVLAALLGPELIKHTQAAYEPVPFLATYLALAVLPLLAAALLAFADLAPVARPERRHAVPLREIVLRPGFLAAALAGMAAHGTMHLVMASSTVQMAVCGFGAEATANVTRFHALAMFAPGLLTGRLIERFGPRPVICGGAVLFLGCAALSASGLAYPSYFGALLLLGLGWNGMFTGATALLAQAHAPGERMRAQAANDVLVSGAVACAAFGSGVLHGAVGWAALNAVAVLPVALGVWAVLHRRAGRAQLAAA